MTAYFTESSEAMLALEAMIDRVGARNVAHAVEFICATKADHLRTAWQDNATAKQWDKAANAWARFASNSPATPLDQ